MSYLQIDAKNLPDRFGELFELDRSDPNINDKVVSLFRKARLLDSSTGRVIFIDDKIVIFRNEEQLVHKRERTHKYTPGEKKRTEIVTTFNTFEDIYSAIRSQYYTIDNSTQKKDDYKHFQQELLKLIQEIRALWYDSKDNIFARRIDDIKTNIQSATNAKVLAAQLQNLKEITFNNKIIDSNHLTGAKNKLKTRFEDLTAIITIVEKHLNTLEDILTLHQNAIEFFFIQSENKDIHHTLLLSNYNKLFAEIPKQFQQISPFIQFHDAINRYKNNPMALHHLAQDSEPIYQWYKHEHQEKLSNL